MLQFCFFFLLLPSTGGEAWMIHAQGFPNSPVFRGYRPESGRNRDRGEGLRRQINVFLLERDAANGDPLAQHELGVRLLTGSGVAADTAKSAEWLRRAAAQSLPPAMYNYALLLHNGWGVEWNPFAAFRLFREAAERGMPEAQHVTGVYFTDNLVVRQDWDSAWAWISRAAAAAYPPAQRARDEMLRRGLVRIDADSAVTANADEASAPPAPGEEAEVAWVPVLLDFDRPARSVALETGTLIEELLASRSFTHADSLSLQALSADSADTATLRLVADLAAWGHPEAMALHGRLLEEGRVVARDHWRAAECYASAVFLESSQAPRLLQELLGAGRLGPSLASRAWGGDARAQYVWACLKAMDVETRLDEDQALALLERAAAQDHAPALTQLGIAYAFGRWVPRDHGAARTYWTRAARLGHIEARLRLAAMDVITAEPDARYAGGTSPLEIREALALLEEGMARGSLLAQVAVADSHERGVGRGPNPGEAARLYRDAASRGSATAWKALLRMYERLRPEGTEFRPAR